MVRTLNGFIDTAKDRPGVIGKIDSAFGLGVITDSLCSYYINPEIVSAIEAGAD